MKELRRLTPEAGIDEAIAILGEDGAVIIERLAPAATMELIERELAPDWEGIPDGDSEFLGLRTKRASALIAKSRGCRELATSPFVLATIQRILGPMCKTFHLHVTNGARVYPGESRQFLHRDDELFRGYFPHPGPQVLTNVIWALGDFTAENGATRVVVGSHDWEDGRQPDEDDFVQAAMPSGSVLIYLGSVFHGAGENRSRAPRTAIILGYSLGWLRQEENQYLACPPEVARALPEDVQRLIGYAVHPPFLGWVDMKDPHSTLEAPGESQMLADPKREAEIAALEEG